MLQFYNKINKQVIILLIILHSSILLSSCSIVEKLSGHRKEVVEGEKLNVINYIPSKIDLYNKQYTSLNNSEVIHNQTTNDFINNTSQDNIELPNFASLISGQGKIKEFNQIYFEGRYIIENSSSPVFDQNFVYVLETNGALAAIDIKKKNFFARSRKVWENIYFTKYLSSKIDKHYIGGGICISNDLIFVTTGTKEVAAFNKNSGELIWNKKLSSPIRKSPVFLHNINNSLNSAIDKNILLLQAMNGTIYAIDSKDGSNIWTLFDNSSSIQSLVSTFSITKNNILVAINSDEKIYAVNSQNGSLLWQINPVPTMLVHATNYEIDDSKTHKNHSAVKHNIDRENEKNFHENNKILETNLPASLRTNQKPISSTPVSDDNNTYIVAINGSLLSIKSENGHLNWQKHYFITKPIWLSGDFLYTINEQNKVIAVNKHNGEVIWTQNLNIFQNKDSATNLVIKNNKDLIKTKNDKIKKQIIKKQKEFYWTDPIIVFNTLITMREDGLLLIFDSISGTLQREIITNIKNVNKLKIVNNMLSVISNGGIITLLQIEN